VFVGKSPPPHVHDTTGKRTHAKGSNRQAAAHMVDVQHLLQRLRLRQLRQLLLLLLYWFLVLERSAEKKCLRFVRRYLVAWWQ
jgi:hypothetical protein